jgi:hypothetical protein
MIRTIFIWAIPGVSRRSMSGLGAGPDQAAMSWGSKAATRATGAAEQTTRWVTLTVMTEADGRFQRQLPSKKQPRDTMRGGCSCRSELVGRGAVEPPTFRFSAIARAQLTHVCHVWSAAGVRLGWGSCAAVAVSVAVTPRPFPEVARPSGTYLP